MEIFANIFAEIQKSFPFVFSLYLLFSLVILLSFLWVDLIFILEMNIIFHSF